MVGRRRRRRGSKVKHEKSIRFKISKDQPVEERSVSWLIILPDYFIRSSSSGREKGK